MLTFWRRSPTVHGPSPAPQTLQFLGLPKLDAALLLSGMPIVCKAGLSRYESLHSSIAGPRYWGSGLGLGWEPPVDVPLVEVPVDAPRARPVVPLPAGVAAGTAAAARSGSSTSLGDVHHASATATYDHAAARRRDEL